MSLKAQLEAVIYAADEPVTLAQLAILFADEALAWKAEQEAAKAEAQLEDENAEKAIAEAPLLEGAEMQAASAETGEEEGPTEVHPPEQETAEEGKAQESTPDPAEVAAADTAAEEAPEGEAAAEPAAEESSQAEPAGDSPDPAEAVEAEPVEPEETEEARVKRLARQRDREVKAILRQQLDELVADYATDARGVEIREIAGGYRMATKPECHDAVRGFVKSLKPALKLSLPALETLAVIAYKQPVTAPEVNEIRGVDSSGVFGSLLARKLIATAGRKQVIGRPILYKTTKEFLLRFGLKDVNELPSMEEFEKMAASELDDSEEVAATEAVVAPGEPELDENRSEGPEADEPEESESAQLAEDSEPTQPETPIVESPVAD